MKIVTSHCPGHNSNFCYFDGNNIHYLHLERFLERKHFIGAKDFAFSNYAGKIFVKKIVNKIFLQDLNIQDVINCSGIDHHVKHALSMDFFSKQKYDSHVVIDGMGCYKIWSIIKNDQIICSQNVFDARGSIGDIMTFLGYEFAIEGHGLDLAGKVMGLHSYGKFDDVRYEILKEYNMNLLGNTFVPTMIRNKIDTFDIFNILGRKNGYSPYKISSRLENDKRLDALHTIHKKLGEIVLSIFEKYVSPNERVAYSGGVAQNVVWNTELKKRYPKLEILPHCGDEGLSFGIMEFFRRKYDLTFDLSRYPFMQSDEAPDDEPTIETIQKTARHLANGKIVAWYQGRGEVGPRALGHRSILMDPRIKNGKDIINRVKNRESFRPFGASVLSEYAKEYFDLDFENPYMLYLGTTQKDNLDAITHVDGTCRAQTVNKDFDKNFRLLLEYFYDMTGCPVLLNTSLNEAGKPIAGWIRNAINEFNTKAIDILVVGNTVYEK